MLLQVALCFLALLHVQDESDVQKRLIEILTTSKTEWTKNERVILQAHILPLVTSEMPPNRQEQLLGSFPKLLKWWEPRTKPPFSGTFENYNYKFSIPNDLREREFRASLDLIKLVITSGSKNKSLAAAEKDLIRSQMDYLFQETRKLLGSSLRGKSALDVLERKLNLARQLAERSIGKHFEMGLTRVLSQEELQDILTKIRVKSELLNDTEIVPLSEIDMGTDKGLQKAREMARIHALVEDVVGTAGYARVLSNPEAYKKLDVLLAIRKEYREVIRSQSGAMKSKGQLAEKDMWEALRKRRELIRKQKLAREQSEKERNRTTKKPAKQTNRNEKAIESNNTFTILSGILVLLVVVLIGFWAKTRSA